MLELDEDIAAVLRKPSDEALRLKASKTLLNLNVRAGSLAISLLDAGGTVVASSNWYEPDSPVGMNLASNELFKEAVRSNRARTFEADPMRAAPQYEFAHAVLRRDRAVGVITVRVSLESIESTWIEYAAGSLSEKLLVIDDNNVVIMSSNPAWRYKTISALSPARRQALEASGRYAFAPLDLLGLTVLRPLDFGTRLVALPDKGAADRPAHYVAEEQKMSRPGWRLMTLSSAAPVRHDALNNASAAAVVGTLGGLLGYYLVQRRRVIAQLLVARAAIQHAKDELEVRVHERTLELQGANVALVGEIAKHKRTEQHLRETQDELVQSSRLAVLGQMSAGITHEINQPLTALRALSDNSRQLLQVGRVQDVDFNLTVIADLTDRMGRITKQLKTFAHKAPAASESESVLLASAVANALELLRPRIQSSGVKLAVDVGANLLVPCDRYRLEQVLLNLFSNALEAMHNQARKQLTITAQAVDGEARARMRVSDTGTGLPEAVRSRLFEPFFSTKPPGEGLGLGLVISSSIVRELGGTLKAFNLPEGAAFEFDLRLQKGVA
jgi:C4-dicarboxylate-specific signal transduction histidine kinase